LIKLRREAGLRKKELAVGPVPMGSSLVSPTGAKENRVEVAVAERGVDEDTCAKTRLPKEWCAHCNSVDATSLVYELVEGSFQGSPTIEVLRDGGPIHEFDKNFRFGLEKAKLILGAMKAIESFSNGLSVQSKAYSDPNTGANTMVHVEPHSDFTRSDGRHVEAPWLRLESIPQSYVKIGIGYQKALACLFLKDELRAWVEKRRR
jgi:hypothetical protein